MFRLAPGWIILFQVALSQLPVKAGTCTSANVDQIFALGSSFQTDLVPFEVEFDVDVTVTSITMMFSEDAQANSYDITAYYFEAPFSIASATAVSMWETMHSSNTEVPSGTFRTAQLPIIPPKDVPANTRVTFAVGADTALSSDRPIALSEGLGTLHDKIVALFPQGRVFEVLGVAGRNAIFSGGMSFKPCSAKAFRQACSGGTTQISTIKDKHLDPSAGPPLYGYTDTVGVGFPVGGVLGGVMFDVQTSKKIEVKSFSVALVDVDNNPEGAIVVSVWTKTGSFAGSERDRAAWQLVGRQNVVFDTTAAAFPFLAQFPSALFEPVVINANAVQSFYITVHGGTGAILRVDGDATTAGTVLADDGNVQVKSGVYLLQEFDTLIPGTPPDLGGFLGYMGYTECSTGITFCFSGSSLVNVRDKGVVPMRDLKLGDFVQVGKAAYEPIYSFGHFSPQVRGEFILLRTASSSLQVTSQHMVFVEHRGAVPAGSIRVGDSLVAGHGTATVVSISSVTSKGAFAPFTPSGKIIVDDVLVSSFVALEDKEVLYVAGIPVSSHWLAHAFEFPHRVCCYYLGQCVEEAYDENGIAFWVSLPLKVSQWILKQNLVIRPSLLLIATLAFLAFATLEICLLYPARVFAFVCLAAAFMGSCHVKVNAL